MFCNNCGNQVQPFNKFCPRCGAPVAAQDAPQPPPAPQPTPPPYQPASSFGAAPRAQYGGGPLGQPPKKSGCGKVLLILSIVLLLLGGGIAAAIYYGYHYAEKALKSSEAYSIALDALKENARVREKMGEIKETGFPLGSFKEDADGTGSAAYSMSVEGAKASGRYNVVMRRENRKWRLLSGAVTLSGGETINVMSDDESGDDDDTDAGGNSNSRPPVPMKPPPPGAISGGVLNGKAIELPKPAYPPAAKAVHASGTVNVQVVVDESGSVTTADAISGHPLLRAAAVAAAKQARFSPTKLAGRPVKVSGIITYNFEPQ